MFQPDNTVQLSTGSGGLPTSTDGSTNTVYEFARSGNGYDTINLINLFGENTSDVFDANGDRPAPNAQTDVNVKYYYGSGTVNRGSVASPDY